MTITIEDLSERERRDIIGAMLEPKHETRKRREHLRERYLVMRDEYEGLLQGWIKDVYRETDIIAELNRHVLPLFNPPKRAVDRLAVAYTYAPVRRIGRRHVNVTETQQWTDTLERSRYNLYAREWNRAQIAYNASAVIPLPRRNDEGDLFFDYQIVTGSIGEVVFEEGRSPFDPPDILLHMLPHNLRTGAAFDPSEPVVRSVDAEWIVHWNWRGQVVGSLRHGVGTFPGAVVRNTVPDADVDSEGWWQAHVNIGAFRVMRATARIVAALDWTRKTQCRKLIAIAVDTDGPLGGDAEDEGETLTDPEATYKVRDASLQVHDLDQSVKNFREHIQMYQDEALELMTGAASNFVDPDPRNPIEGASAARSHAAIMLHRRWQLEQLRPVDLRLQRVMAGWLHALGAPDAPDPQKIRDEAVVEFQPLPFVDDPQKRLNWYVLASKFGIADQVMAMVEQYGITEDHALERLKQMAERKAAIDSIRREHNTPADSTELEDDLPGEDIAQRQGRDGGQRTSPPSQAEAAR